MILSDFASKGCNCKFYFAEVTVTTTTGALWWKKTQGSRRKIAKDRFGVLWFFVDDGKPTPGFQAEELERSFMAANHFSTTEQPKQPREQHLEWCKKRALAYVDQGYLQEALSLMISDLRKHPKTADHPGIALAVGRMAFGDLTTKEQVREFIQGFS